MSKFIVEVIIDGKATILRQEEAMGWSDKATATQLEGRPMEIMIVKDGKLEVGFNISEEGIITVTSHGNAYKMFAPQNLQLTPTRPWKERS